MKKYDFILILVIIAVSAALFCIFSAFKSSGDYVSIVSDGREAVRLPLDADTEYSVGGKNIVTIKDGKAFVSYADCPDKLCIKQGEISDTGKTIVCLPNRLTVKIIKKDGDKK